MRGKDLKNVIPFVEEPTVSRRRQVGMTDELYLVLEGPGGTQECTIRDYNGFGLSFYVPEHFVEKHHFHRYLSPVQVFQGRRRVCVIPSPILISVTQPRHLQLLVDIQFENNFEHFFSQRSHEHIELDDDFQPVISFQHPLRYDHPVAGKVIQLSKKGVLVSLPSDQNDLLPFLTVSSITLTLTNIGNVTCSAQVQSIHTFPYYPNKVFVYLGFENLQKFVFELFGQLLLVHGKSKKQHENLMQTLKTAGLNPKKVKRHLSFSYLKTDQDYVDMLNLRLLSYRAAQKVPKEMPYSAMADRYDDQSAIILCRHHDRLVGSIRVTYCPFPEDRFELDESIQMPPLFQNRTNCVEMSRLCVHPDYQGTDIMIGLIERSFMHSLKTGETFLITSCVEKMWPLYRRMGFKRGGVRFELKTLHGVPHEFIYVRIKNGLTGLGMHPSMFFLFFSKIVGFNLDFGSREIKATRWIRLWIRLYSTIGKTLLGMFLGKR